MADAWIDLADAIEGLRSTLTETIDRSAAERMHFHLEPVELTLQTVVTYDAHGKIGWKIIEAGGSRGSASTQVIKLTLTPLWTAPDGSLVNDPLISATLPAATGQAPRRDGGLSESGSTPNGPAAPAVRGVAAQSDTPDD